MAKPWKAALYMKGRRLALQCGGDPKAARRLVLSFLSVKSQREGETDGHRQTERQTARQTERQTESDRTAQAGARPHAW